MASTAPHVGLVPEVQQTTDLKVTLDLNICVQRPDGMKSKTGRIKELKLSGLVDFTPEYARLVTQPLVTPQLYLKTIYNSFFVTWIVHAIHCLLLLSDV